MAQSGSSDVPHGRFSSGYISSSQGMAPLPANGLGFDARSHLQRFVQSSAMPDEAAFQMQQQVRQFYLQQQAASQNGSSAAAMPVDSQRVSDDADMVSGPPKDEHAQQLGQSLRSFVHESMRGVSTPGLMRYHSAPSSMLDSIVGMGGALFNRDAELGRFFPNDVSQLESDGAFHPMDRAHALSNGDEGPAGCVAGAAADNNPDRNSGIISPHSRFKPVGANGSLTPGQLLPGVCMDVKDERSENSKSCFPAPLIHPASDDVAQKVRAAPGLASSFSARSSFMPSNIPLENGNELIHATKNGLLRHSSSPAGFLSQLNDDNERFMMPSSSGNSSEEGSYEKQGGLPFFGNYAWDEAGNVMVGLANASYAARKRIRDSEEKYYAGSTLMDSQKGDAIEHGAFANHFGLPTDTSPENVYFTDKLSPGSVPCRTRAKRGCATHPRSIAERIRRTKISERMKKLQELVPNMDKQTNTAEMLDEAVEYVKYLQRQVQDLTESQLKCECSCSRQKETIS